MSEIQKRNKRIAQVRKQLQSLKKADKKYSKAEGTAKANLYQELVNLGVPSKFGNYWIKKYLGKRVSPPSQPRSSNSQQKTLKALGSGFLAEKVKKGEMSPQDYDLFMKIAFRESGFGRNDEGDVFNIIDTAGGGRGWDTQSDSNKTGMYYSRKRRGDKSNYNPYTAVPSHEFDKLSKKNQKLLMKGYKFLHHPLDRAYGPFQIRGFHLDGIDSRGRKRSNLSLRKLSKGKISTVEDLKDPKKAQEAAYLLYKHSYKGKPHLRFAPWGVKGDGTVLKRSATPIYKKQYSLAEDFKDKEAFKKLNEKISYPMVRDDGRGFIPKEPKEEITGTVEETVTDKDLKHFDDRPEEVDQKLKAPVKEITAEDQVKIEGQPGIALSPTPDSGYIPSHTSLDQLPEEMKVEDKVEIEGPSGLNPAQTAAMPTAEAKGVPVEEKVSDPQDLIVDYKNRQVQGFQEGGSVLQEPELSEDEEIAARQTGDTDIISEAVEDKVEGTVPQDSWRLKPKEPKPPVEASFDEQGNVVLTKQQEIEDVSTKSDQELKDSLKETVEVKSKPGSDTVTLSPRKSQVQRNKALKTELDKRKKEEEARAALSVQRGIEETQSIMAKPEVKVDLKEKVDVEETADPQAFDLQTYIQQTLQRDDEAREIMKNELAKANEAELNIQKVEPYRFWNTMSTPAKIVAGIGMLIGGYAAKDSPAGLQAVMNVIDGAVNADIQAQKLTQEQQLVVAKEATRRAKAAVDKYKAVATSPMQKAKLMELAQALEVKKAGVAKKQQLQALKTYVMNRAREGKLHLVPPSLMRMVYPKEDMKRIDTMRTNYEKERKDRKIQPVLSAYRRMHNLISRKEEITGMDDIAIVFSFMKLLDPGSVVRESEFETAANAGPRAKWFARQWNRFITGGRFTQADRKGFLKSALTIVKPALDEEKDLQRKYISMSRRYGYPAAFVIPPSTRYFDLPGTRDDAAVRRIMKEQGKTRDEAESIHFQVTEKVKPRYVYRKGVKYRAN